MKLRKKQGGSSQRAIIKTIEHEQPQSNWPRKEARGNISCEHMFSGKGDKLLLGNNKQVKDIRLQGSDISESILLRRTDSKSPIDGREVGACTVELQLVPLFNSDLFFRYQMVPRLLMERALARGGMNNVNKQLTSHKMQSRSVQGKRGASKVGRGYWGGGERGRGSHRVQRRRPSHPHISRVIEFKEGDLVIPTFLGECKQCENCKSGQTNVCTTYPMPMHGLMPDNTTRMSLGGQKLYHLFSCSTWSKYTVANVNYVVKIDHRNMPLAHASFISCGFTTGLGAPWKECKAGEDSSVAVFGLGTVGLGAIQGASMQGASRIIGIDKNEVKAAKGQVFGMTDFINPDKYDKSIAELTREGTGGSGADYCFECTGAPPLVAEVLDDVKPRRGTLVQMGVGPKPAMEVLFSTLLQGRTVKGYAFGGIESKSELPIVVDKCANKEINLDELLTHEISLDEIDQPLDLLKKPDCVKVLIKI
ncbi:alcohol dehydrogenase 1-like [Cornus florida]|uniref:alcohol dehydrogenase 1-like n=1 Tax=Cornus florida TaxID=4283 RepID=UPI0028A0A26C|nr:alcohol dehydrogenase 1-like [Cornus florida]